MQSEFLVIGIDGGATKVNAWSIVVESENAFRLGDFNVQKSYREIAGYIENFQPVDLNVQLTEWEADNIRPTAAENQQAHCYIKAAVVAIEQIVTQSGYAQVLLGIGMPGIKTRNERGIAVLKNGPRMTDYASRIEEQLSVKGINLVTPISHIGSDAYYCGIGEEYATEGLFRTVQNSYYLGGGTGAADALKLNGRVIPLDETKGWFVKAWEMKCPAGHSVERYVSSKGIQAIYGEHEQRTVDNLSRAGIFPPQIRRQALQGEKAAVMTMHEVAHYLALLLYERITSLYAGWQGLFQFVNPNRPAPSVTHAYQRIRLDNIIIGQRLGDLLLEARGDTVLWVPFIAELSRLINDSTILDQTAKQHYCNNGQFKVELIQISRLREAPALGAGIDAYLTWRKNC